MKKINYEARNFVDLRSELINYAREYYPEILNDFNDASIGIMLLELNAAIGDNLAYHTDRMFQETQIDYAQEKRNILALARTYGLKIPFKKPSISVVDVSCVVPVNGDTFDVSYAPLILKGSQFKGSGKIFETINDIDFSSPFGYGGLPNRLVLPRLNSNGDIISYELVKREIVVNGSTKIFSKVITQNEAVPFFELILPDQDILSIESVIALQGTSFSETPNNRQFNDFNLKYFEVNSLAEDKIFVIDKTVPSDSFGVPYGKYVRVNKKFVSEYTDNGFLKLTFGNGIIDNSYITEFDVNPSLVNLIGDFINNNSLGEKVKPNTTLFIKYRVGGGIQSNVGSGVINSLGISNIQVNGFNEEKNLAVKRSITVTNPIPAIGGRDELSVEEIRNLIKYNFSAQNRAVTIKDYKSIISTMPGDFGIPFKNSVFEEQNKIKIVIMGQNSNGKLDNTSNSALQNNLSEFLSDYRMINDYVEISNAKIYNISVDCDIFIDKNIPRSQVTTEVINIIKDFFDVSKRDMGENLYIGSLIENINNVSGVINVTDIKFYNKVGGGIYSNNIVSQKLVDEDTKMIDLKPDYTLYGDPTGMFEIKFPNKDIRISINN